MGISRLDCLNRNRMKICQLIFPLILYRISSIGADFVVTSVDLNGKKGAYFLLGDETEASVNSALGLSWPKSGKQFKASVIRGGSRVWCGKIKVWDGHFDGVHGRRDQEGRYGNVKNGQWVVGDKIKVVTECSSVFVVTDDPGDYYRGGARGKNFFLGGVTKAMVKKALGWFNMDLNAHVYRDGKTLRCCHVQVRVEGNGIRGWVSSWSEKKPGTWKVGDRIKLQSIDWDKRNGVCY